MTMKRRPNSLQDLQGGVGGGSTTPMGSSGPTPIGSWYPVPGLKSMADLPREDGKIIAVDTNARSLTNSATNPTGAVAIVKSKGQVYCTNIACSSCSIPLTKAKVLPPNEETNTSPRLSCDFCSATYNLRTGERVASVESGNFFGGMVKGLFSKKESASLPVYALGEKNGKVVINL